MGLQPSIHVRDVLEQHHRFKEFGTNKSEMGWLAMKGVEVLNQDVVIKEMVADDPDLNNLLSLQLSKTFARQAGRNGSLAVVGASRRVDALLVSLAVVAALAGRAEVINIVGSACRSRLNVVKLEDRAIGNATSTITAGKPVAVQHEEPD